jgi:hypothetical protein
MNIFLEIAAIIIITVAIIYILSIINSFVQRGNGLSNRIKDNFAIIIYSLTPHAFAAIILFPFELILFGEYLFSTNPSPFAVKEITAYMMLGLESLVVLWSIFLLIIGNYVITKNLFYSLIAALIVNAIIFYSLYITSKILF